MGSCESEFGLSKHSGVSGGIENADCARIYVVMGRYGCARSVPVTTHFDAFTFLGGGNSAVTESFQVRYSSVRRTAVLQGRDLHICSDLEVYLQ